VVTHPGAKNAWQFLSTRINDSLIQTSTLRPHIYQNKFIILWIKYTYNQMIKKIIHLTDNIKIILKTTGWLVVPWSVRRIYFHLTIVHVRMKWSKKSTGFTIVCYRNCFIKTDSCRKVCIYFIVLYSFGFWLSGCHRVYYNPYLFDCLKHVIRTFVLCFFPSFGLRHDNNQ